MRKRCLGWVMKDKLNIHQKEGGEAKELQTYSSLEERHDISSLHSVTYK